MVVCKHCGVEKPKSSFNKETRSKSGIRCECAACSRKYLKEYRKTDKWAAHLKKNAEKHKECQRRFREENREYVRLRQQKYRAKNPKKIKEYSVRTAEKRIINAPGICTIYLLKNKINNKVYVGQTWQTLKDRFDNGMGYNRCVYLQNALNKYGKENFEYAVLVICNTQYESDYWELFYIKLFDSTNTENGYNLKFGGSAGRHSEETKKKMSMSAKGRRPSQLCLDNSAKVNKGKIVSEETRLKQSIAKKGKPSPHIGKKVSEERRLQISLINVGRKHSEESKMNMSLSKIGRVVSEETRIKIGQSNRGKTISEDTRHRLRLSHLGHKQSEETRQKRSASLTGRIVTEETRRKISEANRGRSVPENVREKISATLMGNTNRRNK